MVVGETVQDDVHLTGDLTGLHHRDVQVVEDLRALFHGRGEVRAAADRVHEDLTSRFIPGSRHGPEHLERLQQGETRADHGGELAREDDDLLDLRAAAGVGFLAGERVASRTDCSPGCSSLVEAQDDERALPAELGDGVGLGLRLDGPLDGRASVVLGGVLELDHGVMGREGVCGMAVGRAIG